MNTSDKMLSELGFFREKTYHIYTLDVFISSVAAVAVSFTFDSHVFYISYAVFILSTVPIDVLC